MKKIKMEVFGLTTLVVLMGGSTLSDLLPSHKDAAPNLSPNFSPLNERVEETPFSKGLKNLFRSSAKAAAAEIAAKTAEVSCREDLLRVRSEAEAIMVGQGGNPSVKHANDPEKVSVQQVLKYEYAQGVVMLLSDSVVAELCGCQTPACVERVDTIKSQWKTVAGDAPKGP